MESRTALEVTERNATKSTSHGVDQHGQSANAKTRELSSKFSQLFNQILSGGVNLGQAADPLATFSELTVAAPPADSPEKASAVVEHQPKPEEQSIVTQKKGAETESATEKELDDESNSDFSSDLTFALLPQAPKQATDTAQVTLSATNTPVAQVAAQIVATSVEPQQVEMQLANTAKAEKPRDATPPPIAPKDMLAKQVAEITSETNTMLSEQSTPELKRTAPVNASETKLPGTPAKEIVSSNIAEPTSQETQPKSQPIPGNQHQTAPHAQLIPAGASDIHPVTEQQTDLSITAPDSRNALIQTAQVKAAAIAAAAIEPAAKAALAPAAHLDPSKGFMGLKAEAIMKLSAAEGRPTKPLVTRASQNELIDKVQKALTDAARSKDGNTLSFRLDPPELGALTVKLTRRADELHARIIPENNEVESVVRERLGELQTALQNAGIKVNQIHISVGKEYSETEMFQFGYAHLDNNAAHRDANEHRGAEKGGRESRSLAGSMSGFEDADKNRNDTTIGARSAMSDSRPVWVA